MEKKIIITIGRQYGSGGRYVGKKLAEQLGIAFYDKELINLASKESGICGEFFEKADERNSGSLLKALAMGFSMNNAIFQSNDYLSNESLFQIQSDVIRKVAAEQSCILVGRCADYILRDNENCISVFISARMEDGSGGLSSMLISKRKKPRNISGKQINPGLLIIITIPIKSGGLQNLTTCVSALPFTVSTKRPPLSGSL